MKKAILAAAIALILGLAAHASATSFTEWDQMTFEQQSDFMADRISKIHQWHVKNEPAKAKCIVRKFTPEPGQKISRAVIDLEKEIKGVPTEDRGRTHIETLMVSFVDRACAPPEQAAR